MHVQFFYPATMTLMTSRQPLLQSARRLDQVREQTRFLRCNLSKEPTCLHAVMAGASQHLFLLLA